MHGSFVFTIPLSLLNVKQRVYTDTDYSWLSVCQKGRCMWPIADYVQSARCQSGVDGAPFLLSLGLLGVKICGCFEQDESTQCLLLSVLSWQHIGLLLSPGRWKDVFTEGPPEKGAIDRRSLSSELNSNDLVICLHMYYLNLFFTGLFGYSMYSILELFNLASL